ncbi:MAG: hypothetical protein COB53_03495 [Elusimicrobia bacterium]|nr:MAG: hypothetical protein COB53_03495 [Elusimicrobiota bacterium]
MGPRIDEDQHALDAAQPTDYLFANSLILMVELNRNQFRRKDSMSALKENMGTIITAILVVICILVSARMQKKSAPQHIQAEGGVVLDMLPARSDRDARRGADPLPNKRSSLDVRPVWGYLPGLEKPEPPTEPDPEPEPEPEVEPVVAAPTMPTFKTPDLSDLMKGVKAAAPQMKKAEFGATTSGGQSGGGGFRRITSFEDQERSDRAAQEKERQAAGPPIGANNAQKAAAMNRLKQAIKRGGSPEAMQKFGLALPQLYQLQEAGHDMSQYVSPEGTLNISDQDAAAMASQLGITNAGPDKKTPNSVIRP